MTSLAVKIHTKAVGTSNGSPGIWYTLWKGAYQSGSAYDKPREGDQRSVELVDEGADHGSDGGANDLPPELGFGRGTEEMARLEVLHEVPRLEGALLLSVCCCSPLRVETHTASDYSRRFVSKLIADSYDEEYVPPRRQPG